VRQVAESHLNHGDVKRVERRIENGQVDYLIDFQKDNGQHQEMMISENGQILINQLLNNGSVGAPATFQSGSTPATSTSTSTSTTATNSNTSLFNRLGHAIFDQQK